MSQTLRSIARLLIVILALAAPGRPANADDPKVTLKSAGAEPLNTLRIHPVKGARTTAEMTMSVSMEQRVGGSKMPMGDIPTMKFGMQITVRDVAANGDITYDFTYDKVEVVDASVNNSQSLQAMKKAMKTIEGTKGHAKVTDRGIVKSTDMELPAKADAMVRQQIESMKASMKQAAAPLPEEPVGVGAIWETETLIIQGGMTIKQTTTVTLEDKHEDILNLQIQIAQTAEPQEIRSDQLPPGSSMRLDSLKSTGKGRSKQSLADVWPTRSKMELNNDCDMTVNMNNTKQSFQQHMDMTMELSGEPTASKPAASP